jgi:hypothetical protein
MTNLHRSPPMNQSNTDLGIVNESQLLRFSITVILAGVLWQRPSIGNETSQTSQQITASLAPPPTGPDWATLRRGYFGESKDRFDRNLGVLIAVLNSKGLDALKIAGGLSQNFAFLPAIGFVSQRYEPFKNGTPQKVTDLLNEIHEVVWGKMLKENPDQLSDLSDVIQNEVALNQLKQRMSDITQQFNSFRFIYEKGDEQIS